MQITSTLAIYFLFWVLSAFVMLPFGVRTAEEVGAPMVPGQADSAPANFQPRKLMLRATFSAMILTSVFVANYQYGWVTVADIDILPKPPSSAG